MTAAPARPVRFGVQLQGQRTTWPAYLAAIREVEALGFDSVWNFDHLLPFSGPDDDPAFETLTTLAAMAMATERVRIGTLVNGVLYRDPATLAKASAMVDVISDGRLEFTLGAAWAEREFRAYGLPYPPIRERLERLDEALTIVKALWTQPRATYEGRHYRVHDAPCAPKPVQRPHPPIMIGGNGRGTLRLTAKHADAWNGQGAVETCAERVAVLQEECRALGRDPAEIELTVHPSLAIAPTYDEAEAQGQAIAQGHGQRFDTVRDRYLVGTPAEVCAQVQGYVDIGMTHIIMGVAVSLDRASLRLFAEEVIPTFR